VKTPLCNFCLKSGIFCPQCQEEIRLGKVSDVDIRIAKILTQLEKTYPPLQKISFYKAYEVKDVLALVVGLGEAQYLTEYEGRILKDIQKRTGRRVKVLEKGGKTRKFLEDLFKPVSITTINTIWLPDGSIETRVILPSRARRLPADVETLLKLAKNIRGITLRIEFQRSNRVPLKIRTRRFYQKRPSK
jgi:transcription antitermination factor NusA-like protein